MDNVWTTLEGYTAGRGTEKAILLLKGRKEFWVPRSVLMGGDSVDYGETDIVMRTWFAEKEGFTDET